MYAHVQILSFYHSHLNPEQKFICRKYNRMKALLVISALTIITSVFWDVIPRTPVENYHFFCPVGG
jgi:hypothetical protein